MMCMTQNAEILAQYEIGDFIVPKKTNYYHYQTKNGISKKEEWATIEGSPCKVIGKDTTNYYIQSFCSNNNRHFIVPIENSNDFNKCIINDDNEFTDLSKYPIPINVDEFEIYKKKVDMLFKRLNKTIKELPEEDKAKKILEDKLGQLWSSQGASCDTIDKLKKCCNNENTLKRTDNRLFNRNSRWCPPVKDSMTYEEYETCNSFPYPLGIRSKDFCLPSELIITMKEMVNQIINFKNIKQDTKKKFLEILELDDDNSGYHKCKWCGDEIDADKYCSEYSSKDNFIEICHRNPKERFISSNMYWGHGECNRQQGGYSEKQRVEQIVQLIKSQPELLTQLIKSQPELLTLVELQSFKIET